MAIGKEISDLRKLLSGGDRRSLAEAARGLALVVADRRLVAELVKLTDDADWLVCMRALDLLEKLAHSHSDWVEPHKEVFLRPLADQAPWEFHLQIVRALPLFRWPCGQRERVISILRRDVSHRQAFVRAWALDSLAAFSVEDPSLASEVDLALDEFERSGRKALVTRARKIRDRLQRGASGAGKLS